MDQDLVSIQEVRTKVSLAYEAWKQYRTFSQQQVDAIVEAMAAAARSQAQRLAEMAVEETGYGNVPDKYAKNLLTSDLLPRRMRGMRTVGLLRELPDEKILEYGVGMGVVAAILPTTNPTSTAIYKALIALKAGCAIVLSPHPRARRCTCETAALLYDAALRAGAPEHIIECVTTSTLEATNALMKHDRTSVILSTGGAGIVKAAYSSGKPAFGVGPGNVPVLVDPSADVAKAIASIVQGKSFDYGTVCSSEQTIVAERSLRDRIISELKAYRAFVCDEAQSKALARVLVKPNFSINPDCVGQAPGKIATMAGFAVPPNTSILVAEIGGVGKEHPLSAEKLSPVLSLLFVDHWDAALKGCESILSFGGKGHTCVIYAQDDAKVRTFGERMPAFRVLVNTPSPQGSTGITTSLMPSMTLGCGAIAGNVTSDNVGAMHLVNIKRVAYVVRRAEDAFEVPLALPRAPAVSASSSGGSIDRAAIVAAVERYLAQRGITPQSAAPTTPPAPVAPAPNTCGVCAHSANTAPVPASAAPPQPVASVADVVDRFLSTRRTAPAAVAAAPAPASEPPPAAAPLVNPAPPAPVITIVDFVCEDDVRRAIAEKRKIFIGPKTIVTPAARDAASRDDVLVMAQR